MKVRAALLATTMLYAAPALALVDPPASKDDGHIRSIVYDPNNPVQLFVTPGASLRIELGADESVATIVVSDQRTIAPEPEALQQASGTTTPGTAEKTPASCDPNLCRSVAGNFVYLKPLRQLDPQPLFIQTQRMGEDGKPQMVPYTFELLTRTTDQPPLDTVAKNAVFVKNDPPQQAKPPSVSTVWSIRFVYPERVKAAQVAAWLTRKHEADESRQRLAEVARPTPAIPGLSANIRYGYRGQPSVKPDAAWDDGRSTFIRYNGNRRVPNIYSKLPDGHESIPAVSVEPDATGNTVRIAHTETKWFVRDGDEAGCVFDLGPDPEGRNSATMADARSMR